MAKADRRRRLALQELQQLQERFDRDRGFDFPELTSREGLQLNFRGMQEEDAAALEATLRRVEYAALALGGEVGELANAVKKARRAFWQGESPDAALANARHEVADVLAYLLKFASLLGHELDRLYLEKLSQNCLRFPSKVGVAEGGRTLSIAGPSGSGKTTVARALSELFPAYIEVVDENPYLAPLLNGSSSFDAFANQTWFLDRLKQFIQGADPHQSLVLDQEPAAIVQVYAEMFLDEGRLTPSEYTQLIARLLRLESKLARWPGRRLVVFLDAPAEVLHERARRRGGAAPPLSWFASVRDRFTQLQQRIPGSLTIPTAGLPAESVVERVRTLLLAALEER